MDVIALSTSDVSTVRPYTTTLAAKYTKWSQTRDKTMIDTKDSFVRFDEFRCTHFRSHRFNIISIACRSLYRVPEARIGDFDTAAAERVIHSLKLMVFKNSFVKRQSTKALDCDV